MMSRSSFFQRLLVGTAVDNGRLEQKLDLTSATASCFEIPYHLHACLVRHLAEDDMLAIEPGCNDGRDEELRSIATSGVNVSENNTQRVISSRVGSGVGHGQ